MNLLSYKVMIHVLTQCTNYVFISIHLVQIHGVCKCNLTYNKIVTHFLSRKVGLFFSFMLAKCIM